MSGYVTRRPWWYPKIIWGASLDGASYVFSIRLPKRYSFYFYWEGPCHKRGTTSNLLSKMCLFNSVVFLKQPLSTVWKNHCFEVGSENDCFLLLWAIDFKTFWGFTSRIVTVCMCSTHQPGQGLFLFFALLLSYWEWRWGMILHRNDMEERAQCREIMWIENPARVPGLQHASNIFHEPITIPSWTWSMELALAFRMST